MSSTTTPPETIKKNRWKRFRVKFAKRPEKSRKNSQYSSSSQSETVSHIHKVGSSLESEGEDNTVTPDNELYYNESSGGSSRPVLTRSVTHETTIEVEKDMLTSQCDYSLSNYEQLEWPPSIEDLRAAQLNKEKSIHKTKELRTELKLAQSKIESQGREIRELQKHQEKMMTIANDAVREVEMAGNLDAKAHALEVEIELSKSKIQRNNETISLQNATIEELRSEHERTNQLVSNDRVETEKLRRALHQKNRELFQKLAIASENLMEGERVKKLLEVIKVLNSQIKEARERSSPNMTVIRESVDHLKEDKVSEVLGQRSTSSTPQRSAISTPKSKTTALKKTNSAGKVKSRGTRGYVSSSTPKHRYYSPKVRSKKQLSHHTTRG